MEACWRLLELPLHGRSHAVQKLPVHLPDMQRVYFQDDDDLGEVVDRPQQTPLTMWFDYNANHTDGRHLTYADFPKEFTWKSKQKVSSSAESPIGDQLQVCMFQILPTSVACHWPRP